MKKLELLKYYSKVLFLSILAFLGLFSLFRWSLNAKGIQLSSWRVLNDESGVFEDQDVTVPFYKLLQRPVTVVLATKIEKTLRTLYLYLPQVNGSFLAVYANDHLVGSVGFRNDRTAHLWYRPFLLEIPAGTENITIELSGVHELSIEMAPTLIDEEERFRFSVLNFLSDTFVKINIGLCLTLALVLYLVSESMPMKKRQANRLFALSALLAAIWMSNMTSFCTMYNLNAMLLFRKISIASAYIAFSFLSIAIARGFFESFSLMDRLVVLINASIAVLLWAAPDNYVLNLIRSRVALVLFFNVFYITYRIFRTYSKVLAGFSLFFVLTVIFDALVLLLRVKFKMLSGFGTASMFLGFSYNLVLEYREMMIKATVSHMRSLIDPLTGAYNRGILVETTFNEKDCFVYLDLNSFKQINDTYGHEVGDKILVLLVNTIRSRIKQNDIVVRMGGDEFLVVVRDCDPAIVTKLFDEVLAEFQNSHELKPTFSYGIKKFEGSYQRTLRAVDIEMYKMKEEFKRT